MNTRVLESIHAQFMLRRYPKYSDSTVRYDTTGTAFRKAVSYNKRLMYVY